MSEKRDTAHRDVIRRVTAPFYIGGAVFKELVGDPHIGPLMKKAGEATRMVTQRLSKIAKERSRKRPLDF